MTSSSPLLIDMSGIARLAAVQRPVASMWRTRSTGTGDPFPPPVTDRAGRTLFDAASVAKWLIRTGRGNNPDAVADAAASAAPAGFDITDAGHVASVDALLALVSLGEQVAGATIADLEHRAANVDPEGAYLTTEVASADSTWTEWAELLADAAYSPAQASRLLERRHASTTSAAGSAGSLTSEGESLIIGLAEALIAGAQREIVVSGTISPSLISELVSCAGDALEVVVPLQSESRAIRRRLLCEGGVRPASEPSADGARLHVMRVPSTKARTTPAMLREMDELVLGMRDHDRAIVIAPATVLVDPIAPPDALTRTDALRSGQVRVMVKLPPGLVSSAPREALALWILGRETGNVAIADRFTAVADLSHAVLSSAAQVDLVSDVLAAIGSAREVFAHSFRFTRLVRTSSLIASRGGLVTAGIATVVAARSSRDLPALIDQARVALGEDAPQPALIAAESPTVSPARVGDLITERHLRLISGTRLLPEEFSASGLVAVGSDELDDTTRIGDRRVDPMTFAARHPSARLTAAGDVVFRTSPTVKAWVDPDGSKIVAHPARVLRINQSDPGGLMPELLAADIGHSAPGPAAWRRRQVRRVAPSARRPLHAALAELATQRKALALRISLLENYAELLSDGVVSGVVALPDTEPSVASDLH